MNRVRKVARKWVEQRDRATYLTDRRRRKRNAERKPKPVKDPNRI